MTLRASALWRRRSTPATLVVTRRAATKSNLVLRSHPLPIKSARSSQMWLHQSQLRNFRPTIATSTSSMPMKSCPIAFWRPWNSSPAGILPSKLAKNSRNLYRKIKETKGKVKRKSSRRQPSLPTCGCTNQQKNDSSKCRISFSWKTSGVSCTCQAPISSLFTLSRKTSS